MYTTICSRQGGCFCLPGEDYRRHVKGRMDSGMVVDPDRPVNLGHQLS